MAPVPHNKRLRKQNGMSLLTLKCLKYFKERLMSNSSRSYMCAVGISSTNCKQLLTNCKQLALAPINRVLSLATVANEKPRFRTQAAMLHPQSPIIREYIISLRNQYNKKTFNTDRTHFTNR